MTVRRCLKALFLALLTLVIASCGKCTEGGGDQPPTVVVSGVPPNGTLLVGDELNITVQASDPEGGAVTFDWDYGPRDVTWTVEERHEFLPFSNEASFTWDPLASDAINGVPFRLIFIVTDVAGTVTEKVVTLNILPGNGTPVFRSNASELYDPRSGGELSFNVTVTDQDSESVMLGIDDTTKPAGSSFNQTSAYEGSFTWTPTAEQLERKVHSVTFTADDMQNPVVSFKVTIVIRSQSAVVITDNQTDQTCPGEAVIEHTPLGPQRGSGTPYRFEARLLDPAYDRAVLYISSSPPYNGEPPSNEEDRVGDSVEMIAEGASLLAEISPYTGLVPDSGALPIYYQICAFDDDASGLDAIRCAPSSGDLELWHSFTVYTPDAPDCVDDALDQVSGNDDFATAAPITERWDIFRVCPDSPDYYSVQLRDGESALFSAVFNEGANVSFEAFDDAQNPIEAKASTCTGLVTAQVTAPAGGGTFYFRATGDNANYVMRAFKSGNAAECSDASAEPNDDATSATPVAAGMTTNGEICPDGNDLDVYAIDLAGGDSLTVTHTFSNAAGNLDMTLFGPGQAIDKGGTGTGAFTFGLTDMETLNYTAAQSGTHNLLVFNNNETANAYQLQFQVQAAPPCVDNDQAGHSKAEALIIPADTELTLPMAVCPGAPDWLQRTEFGPVLGELVVTGGTGTIDDVGVTVYDANDNVAGTGVRAQDRLDFDVFPSSAGQYFYKIETTDRVEYEITLIR